LLHCKASAVANVDILTHILLTFTTERLGLVKKVERLLVGHTFPYILLSYAIKPIDSQISNEFQLNVTIITTLDIQNYRSKYSL